MIIDTAFDFRSDANGRDPDIRSPMLKAYQRILYSKPLPNGEVMQLDENLNLILNTRSAVSCAMPFLRVRNVQFCFAKLTVLIPSFFYQTNRDAGWRPYSFGSGNLIRTDDTPGMNRML